VRILLLNQYYAPAEAATAQLLADLGAELARAGHAVTALCSRRSYPDPSIVHPAREQIDGVHVRRMRTTGFGRQSLPGRILDYASFIGGAAGTLFAGKGFDVLVVLTTPPLLPVVGALAARLRGSRMVYWVMDIYPDLAFELGVLKRGGLVGRALDRVSRLALRRADVVVALGETMAERLRERGAARVEVIHNWSDGEAVRPAPASHSALRKAWGWDRRFIVLYSGNLGLAHDFATALDAAELLRDRPEILFAFVGSGPRLVEIEREVARRGLSNVELRSHQAREDLGASLTAGDVHLLTLRDAVAGLVVPSKIYGILAAGRPTLYVGPDSGEVHAILREGRCGTRCAVGDGRALAVAALRYAVEPSTCAEEGRRARELFDRRFARPLALAAHRRVIESLGAPAG
jgi:colanic acid biosynthesis glycosyl transferase WcaI